MCGQGYCADGANCGTAMATYCNQNGLDDTCKNYLSLTQNPENKETVIQTMLESKYPQGVSPIGNPFNLQAVELCNEVAAPGGCDLALTEICGVISDRDSLTGNEDVVQLCGCHLPAFLYNRYSPFIDVQGIVQKECDPLCLYPNAIKEGDGAGGLRTCTQGVCIVDISNINVVDSLINQDITINQVCGTASSGNRFNCYIGLDVIGGFNDIINEKNVNLNEQCGSCSLFDPVNPTNNTPIPCPNGSSGNSFRDFINKNLTTIIVVSAVVVTVGLIMALIPKSRGWRIAGWIIVTLGVIAIVVAIIVNQLPPPSGACSDWSDTGCDFRPGQNCMTQQRLCGLQLQTQCVADPKCSTCPFHWPTSLESGYITTTFQGKTLFVTSVQGADQILGLSPTMQNEMTADGKVITIISNNSDTVYIARSTDPTPALITDFGSGSAANRQWVFDCGIIADPSRSWMMVPFNSTNDEGDPVILVALAKYDISNKDAISWFFTPA